MVQDIVNANQRLLLDIIKPMQIVIRFLHNSLPH